MQTPAEAIDTQNVQQQQKDAPKDDDGPSRDALTPMQRLAHFAPYLAEFVGCFFIALAWNCTELGKDMAHTAPWKPLVRGLTLLAVTYAFSSISGAHMNPAVSCAVGFVNRAHWREVGKFIVCQCLGSIVGVALSCLIFGKIHTTQIGPRPHHYESQCWFVELFYTQVVCLVALNVTVSRHNNPVKAGNQYYALAIGFMMAAGSWAGENISGAFYNPCLAIAVAVFASTSGQVWGYLAAQFVGAMSAAVLFRMMRPVGQSDYSTYFQYWHDNDDLREITVSKLCAEFVGCFVIVFTFGMTVLSNLYNHERAFAAGSALMSMHYAFADLSGGYFNPAVILSVLLNRRNIISMSQGLAYMGMQCLAGMSAALIYTAVSCGETFGVVPVHTDKEFENYKFTGWQIGGVQIVYSFFLSYVALATFTVRGIKSKANCNFYAGLAYGLTNAAGGFAVIHLANSDGNPALTIGVAISHLINGGQFYKGLGIAGCQFLGAIIASCVFRITHAFDYRMRAEEAILKGKSEQSPLIDSKGKSSYSVGQGGSAASERADAQSRAEQGMQPAKAG